jgi:hypothetical protein
MSQTVVLTISMGVLQPGGGGLISQPVQLLWAWDSRVCVERSLCCKGNNTAVHMHVCVHVHVASGDVCMARILFLLPCSEPARHTQA